MKGCGNRRLDCGRHHIKGGTGQMYEFFGDRMDDLINELNEALAA